MRKTFTLILCLLGFAFVYADNVIKLNDETLINDFTSIKIDPSGSGNVLICFADNSSVSVNMNILQVLPNAATGIEQVQPAQFARISRKIGDQLVIEGTNAGDVIRVYNSTGTLVAQSKAAAECTTINLSNCQSGTYVLCIGDTVIKFNR